MASTPKKKSPIARKPKLPEITEGDLILVTWMDACATVGWEDHRESKLKPAHCRSVGWAGKCNEEFIILYADRSHDDTTDHDSNRRLAIPAGWITGIKKVKE